ncbi:MAG: isocitrate/isopropylmalate family dehydrogenase, partial [bacterium]
VMPNLYGDILSDVAAQIAGSVGLAGSANIGTACSMFEAIHGSAPRRAGQNLANPSGLFLGSVMMLVHIGQTEVAERAHNAWLRTIEDGIHTYDIYDESVSKQKVGTKEFAEAVVARLGQKPEHLKAVAYAKIPAEASTWTYTRPAPTQREMVGVDVYVGGKDGSPEGREALAQQLKKVQGEGLDLQMMSNRGIKVWPGGHKETMCVDEFRCRFMPTTEGRIVTHEEIAALLSRIAGASLDFVKVETLCNYDGVAGYSLAQGQ